MIPYFTYIIIPYFQGHTFVTMNPKQLTLHRCKQSIITKLNRRPVLIELYFITTTTTTTAAAAAAVVVVVVVAAAVVVVVVIIIIIIIMILPMTMVFVF